MSSSTALVMSSGLPTTETINQITGYAQAYFGAAPSWSTSSGTYNNGTNSGGNSLTVRQSFGITLTAAGSNACGITFTPANASAVYVITATFGVFNSTVGGGSMYQMIDGNSTVIAQAPGFEQAVTTAAVFTAETLSGIYAPTSTSPQTVYIQLAATSGTAIINSLSNAAGQSAVEWTVTRIA